jgi:hypothetical protein
MLLKGFSRSLYTYSLVTALGLTTAPAFSASACKGLDEASCKQDSSCSWISSYTTKNGNTVSAYCRSTDSKAKQGLNSKQNKDQSPSANAGTTTKMRILEERNG